MTKWFRNLTLDNKAVDIEVKNGIIKQIIKHNNQNKESNYNGALVLAPFNDPHIHIDSALTAGTPHYNQSGELFEGINIWRERKKVLIESDFIERTNKLFNRYVQNGVQNVRAHIDITGESVEIIRWANKQKAQWKNKINLQIVAFPQDGLLSTKSGQKNMIKAIQYGADVLGGIPHYEFSQQLGFKSIEHILDLAKQNNLLVDIHCDEIDDSNSRFLEHLATESWKRNLQQKVTASHTTAFSRYNDAYVARIWRVLKMAKIHFIANPLVNVHLGGRFDKGIKGRGITRVKELIANNINVAFGHDDVQDPWYPLGDANMMQVLFMGIHLCHLMGINEIKNAINLITLNSAKIMQLKDYGIKVGHPAHFIILSENNLYDAIRKIASVKANIRFGNQIN